MTQPTLYPSKQIVCRDLPLAAFPTELPVGTSPSREMVRHVGEWGFFYPLTLMEDPAGIVVHAGARFTLIDGNRRLGCARELSLDTVPVRVIPFTPKGEALTGALNALRDDNIVTEYRAVRTMMERDQMSVSDVARATGMSIPTVKARLSLGDLEPPLLDALERRKISATIAKSAAKLPAEIQHHLAATLAAKGKLTDSDVRDAKSVHYSSIAGTLPLDVFSAGPSFRAPGWRDRALPLVEAALAVVPEVSAASDHEAASRCRTLLTEVLTLCAPVPVAEAA